MAKLNWNSVGDIQYEAGVDKGVYFPKVGKGIAWVGLVSVNEAPTINGAPTATYQDGIKQQETRDLGSFAATVDAFTYPDEIADPETQPFGMSYRTKIADDDLGPAAGYKIHIVYNASATFSPSEFKTQGGTIEPSLFKWGLTTTPSYIVNNRASSHIFIDTTIADDWALLQLENILYGTPTTDPRLPSIEEVIALVESAAVLQIVDHGDGSWTAYGPDDVVYMLDATSFEISYPSAVYVDTETYILSSL